MKAIITKAYGSVDVLSVENVDSPTIQEDEILVQVKAASINPLDWRIRSGEMKIMTGKTPPRILGSDYAGVVSKIGKNIHKYKVGDEVFGLLDIVKVKEGTYAEYVKVKENDINIKPSNSSFEEAASLPLVSLTSYQAFVNIAKAKKGNKVLINGCSGGVGSAAVQIAKALGYKTTGICSTKNVDFAKSLGADHIIDYKKENVLNRHEKYDVIFDTVGNLKFSLSKNILESKGTYVTTAVTVPAMIFSPLANIFRSKKYKLVVVKPNTEDLTRIKQMVEDEELKGQVSKIFNLQEVKEAQLMSQNGGFYGKLVLKV
ncbi:MAG: zinc-binding alcohol dehydrogenase [Bacteroidetes bacterium 4572_77]|nr:MAG: zinc-binding alcohol dehydrogenase [Bacteroidetes bacterium 4572_77]